MQINRVAAFTLDGQGGNPAGVVIADALPPTADMQRLAADVGYSETAFAAPAGPGFTVRYFSPESEVPFCGHATIALGAVLGQRFGYDRYPLSLSASDIEVEALERDGAPYAVLRSPRTSNRSVPVDIEQEALALFGYRPDEVDGILPMAFANAGAEHLIIPLAARSFLARMTYDLDQGRTFMNEHGLVTVAFVVREAERLFHVRNAFASGGVVEDPATGAAAAALAGLLRDQGLLGKGTATIKQGDDMGRPSQIDLEFTGVVGSSIAVGGAVAWISD